MTPSPAHFGKVSKLLGSVSVELSLIITVDNLTPSPAHFGKVSKLPSSVSVDLSFIITVDNLKSSPAHFGKLWNTLIKGRCRRFPFVYFRFQIEFGSETVMSYWPSA